MNAQIIDYGRLNEFVAYCKKHKNERAKALYIQEGFKQVEAVVCHKYDLESFRSYVLDIHDDVSGKSCNPDTLRKIDKVIIKFKKVMNT